MSPVLVKVNENPLSFTLRSNCCDISKFIAFPMKLVRTGCGQLRGSGMSQRELFSQLNTFDAVHLWCEPHFRDRVLYSRQQAIEQTSPAVRSLSTVESGHLSKVSVWAERTRVDDSTTDNAKSTRAIVVVMSRDDWDKESMRRPRSVSRAC